MADQLPVRGMQQTTTQLVNDMKPTTSKTTAHKPRNYNLSAHLMAKARANYKCPCGAPPFPEKAAIKKANKSKGKLEFYKCNNNVAHVRKVVK